MFATISDTGAQIVLIGAVAAALSFLIGLVWKMARAVMRVKETVERSEDKTTKTLNAITPDNGGIGGDVSDIKNSVDRLRWTVTGLRKDVRQLDEKLDAHLEEAAKDSADLHEHIANHGDD